jgi:tight adherence protein C
VSGLMAGAVACGAALGGGLWLFLLRLPFLRPTSFTERIAPQLRSHNLESRLLRTAPGNLAPLGPLERILRPVARDWVRALGRLNPGSSALNRRLARAGSSTASVDFRAEDDQRRDQRVEAVCHTSDKYCGGGGKKAAGGPK